VSVRTVRVPRLQSTVAVWSLDLDSELLFVGDAGTTEPSRPSRRSGVEWTNHARVTPWLRIDGDVAFTRARFTDRAAAGNRIPGAVGRVVSAGVEAGGDERMSGSVRVRHFGPRPLTEDGGVTSEATTLWNAEAGYRIARNTRMRLELFNLFDAAASDIDYYYASRLPGEPADGLVDIHTHPALPRSARLTLQVSF
jgi:outer membrane receptor protein involved in Fe transport